jgi:protein-tyrosine phosphatase
MIDLHCHLLPGIDDGAHDLATSLEMARIATDDGIKTIFCTPHIYPGLYENTGPDIQRRTASLQRVIHDKGIELSLSYGADAHLVPGMLPRIRSGEIPTLGGSQYLLLEPSHNSRPPRFVEEVFAFIAAGITPVVTHPERLTWISEHYDDFAALAKSGAWMQITGGALLGHFGAKAERHAKRFLDDGLAAVIASDGHTTNRRAPQLQQSMHVASKYVGFDEASRLVVERPRAILQNVPASNVNKPPGLRDTGAKKTGKIQALLNALVGRKQPG